MRTKKIIEEGIKRLLKDEKRIMYPDDIAKELNVSFWEVDKVLDGMRKRGLVGEAEGKNLKMKKTKEPEISKIIEALKKEFVIFKKKDFQKLTVAQKYMEKSIEILEKIIKKLESAIKIMNQKIK